MMRTVEHTFHALTLHTHFNFAHFSRETVYKFYTTVLNVPMFLVPALRQRVTKHEDLGKTDLLHDTTGLGLGRILSMLG